MKGRVVVEASYQACLQDEVFAVLETLKMEAVEVEGLKMTVKVSMHETNCTISCIGGLDQCMFLGNFPPTPPQT